MIAHLFVYGSLMSTAGHPMGERLGREGRLLGPASMQGRLYRLSWYPGAVDSDVPDQRVQGEVYALPDPARALQWLDAYEGLDPHAPDSHEYARVERPVRVATGGDLTAWVYLYRLSVAGLAPVPGGRWMPVAR